MPITIYINIYYISIKSYIILAYAHYAENHFVNIIWWAYYISSFVMLEKLTQLVKILVCTVSIATGLYRCHLELYRRNQTPSRGNVFGGDE